jgi:hypothetical protein
MSSRSTRMSHSVDYGNNILASRENWEMGDVTCTHQVLPSDRVDLFSVMHSSAHIVYWCSCFLNTNFKSSRQTHIWSDKELAVCHLIVCLVLRTLLAETGTKIQYVIVSGFDSGQGTYKKKLVVNTKSENHGPLYLSVYTRASKRSHTGGQ